MQEKPTQLLTASHVKDGRILSRMITISPTWEITSSVGILNGLLLPRFGSTPRIMKFCFNMSVPFYLPPSEKLLIWFVVGQWLERRTEQVTTILRQRPTSLWMRSTCYGYLWCSIPTLTNNKQLGWGKIGKGQPVSMWKEKWTRPSILCESQIFRLWLDRWPLKNGTDNSL